MAHPLTIDQHLDRARQMANVSPDTARYHIGAAQTLALCEIVENLDRIARQLEQ